MRTLPTLLLSTSLLLQGCSSLWTFESTATETLSNDPFLTATAPTAADSNANSIETQEQAPLCDPQQHPAFAYRKKIALLGFTIDSPVDTVDLPNLGQRYPQTLAQQLNHDRLIVVDGSSHFLFEQASLGQTLVPLRRQLHELANTLEVQFLLSGRILDLSVQRPEKNLTDGWQQPLEKFNKLWQGPVRQAVIELKLFDGLTGILIANQQFSIQAPGDMDMANKSMNSSFWNSPFGQAVQELMLQQTTLVESSLACLPLQAKVMHLGPKGIYIDAGIDTLLQPGDKLRVTHRQSVNLMGGVTTQNVYSEQAYGNMTITQVYPGWAIGELDKKELQRELKPGDIVRAW